MSGMMSEKEKLSARRDQLLKEVNAAGVWNPTKYQEIQDLGKRIEIAADAPDPTEPELDLEPEVKPKKAR
jgi:hypothetical protein